jgi:hypothetical protein
MLFSVRLRDSAQERGVQPRRDVTVLLDETAAAIVLRLLTARHLL